MHKNATKCNETLSKWCKNKHGASKIMDTLETYQQVVWENIFQQLIIPVLPKSMDYTYIYSRIFFWRIGLLE
jgi:hypothetical protein